jgi:hypothetical protein
MAPLVKLLASVIDSFRALPCGLLSALGAKRLFWRELALLGRLLQETSQKHKYTQQIRCHEYC